MTTYFGVLALGIEERSLAGPRNRLASAAVDRIEPFRNERRLRTGYTISPGSGEYGGPEFGSMWRKGFC
jgi:hypothetical protein